MGWFSSLVGGVIGFFIGGPAGAVIGAGLGATKAGEKLVNSVLDFVLQPFIGNFDIPNADEAQRQQGVLFQREGSVQQVPVVYGYRKVGGVVSFAETGSTNNRYLYVAYVFSEGVVEGLREVFIDDWQLPVEQTASLNAGQLITVNADRYKDRVQLQWYPGVYFDNPRSSPVGNTVKSGIFAEAPSFTSDMVYNGLAVLFARFEWKDIKTQEDADNNPFTGGIPEVQVSMLGKRVASLLTTAESFTYDSATVRYSTNPAEILLDYLRNPRYGKGLLNDDIDWDSWKRTAVKCNQQVTYLTTNSDIRGPIQTLNMVVDTGATLMSNVKTMLQNFRSYMPYVQGKYKLYIEDAGNPTDITSGVAIVVQTFTKDDIVSDVTFNGIERSAKYNVVSVTYVDPDQKFSNQIVVYPETEAERQVYINLDGGRENKLDITLGGITNYAMAKDMARLMFNKSRQQESCVFTATSKALELEPGDTIRIQSNILDFGDDPWRIVSVKINGDMTVDLACVRNPDSIYPHVRVGEEDIVLPPYIPKGSIIYFPSSDNRIPLGLVPPTRAVYPGDFTPNDANPGQTDPNAPGGGGPGGGEGGGGDPQDPINDPPQEPPPPPPFDAVLVLASSSATKLDANFLIHLNFTQPQAGLYDYAIMWWRVNRFSPWIEVRLDTKPGPGANIPATFGPLPAGDYQFYVRAYATDGRASAKVTQGQASVRANSAEINPSLQGIASATTVQVSEGWTLPASEVPSTPRYDDLIGDFNIYTKLSSGAPTDPRSLRVVMRQITNTFTDPINNLIKGVRIFYKNSSDTYWSYEDYIFEATYYPGQQLSFDLSGDFGARVYPSDIIPNTATAALSQFDFFAKLLYEDGQPAEQQLGPVYKAGVEKYIGNYDFVVAGTSPLAQRSMKAQATAGFDYKTVDEDPGEAGGAAAELVASVYQIFAYPAESKLDFRFNPPSPTPTAFRGYKIRFREIVAGENPTYTEIDVGSVAGVDGRIFYQLKDAGYQHNSKYEWIITVKLKNGVEANNSLYGRGRIPMGYRESNNVYGLFNVSVISTDKALGNITTVFPATPVIVAKSWVKVQEQPYDSTKMVSPDIAVGSNTYHLNRYYELKFSLPSTASAIICYRRVYNPYGQQTTEVGTTCKYWKLGPWERVRVAVGDLEADADGYKILRLRGPLDHQYFNKNYEVPGASNNSYLVDRRYGASGLFPQGTSGSDRTAGIYPYWFSGTGSSLTLTDYYTNFFFVIETSSVEEDRGLLLYDFYAATSGADFKTRVDGFLTDVSKDIEQLTSVFNQYTNGYGRNLSEAITAIDLQYLYQQDLRTANEAYTGVYKNTISPPAYATRSSTTRDIRLSAPVSAVTVR
jgi:hypothetical protein